MDNEKDLLIYAVKEGSKTAFEALYKTYYPDLLRFCFSLVRNQEAAEEIVQDLFLYFWEKRQDIVINSSLKSYLFSAVRNRAINYIKYDLPKQQVTGDVGDSTIASHDPDQNELSELQSRVLAAIDQLPEKCKEVFILSRHSELSYAEIAQELKISIKTVENQMSIALKKLRISLQQDIKDYLINK